LLDALGEGGSPGQRQKGEAEGEMVHAQGRLQRAGRDCACLAQAAASFHG
jgi:hypothetical protein